MGRKEVRSERLCKAVCLEENLASPLRACPYDGDRSDKLNVTRVYFIAFLVDLDVKSTPAEGDACDDCFPLESVFVEAHAVNTL